jgi:thiamine biosynthesis lipoprotein
MRKKYLFLSFLFCLFGSCQGVTDKWQASTLLFFDTVCEINLLCTPSDFDSAKKDIAETFGNIERQFSPGARIDPSVRLISLFRRALAIYLDSEGCFDITVGPLSRIWGFRNHSFRVPPVGEIHQALEIIGMDKIIAESDSLILMPGMELDWGGIAKGFGIDLASQALIQTGIKNGFINAGGDLYCWGKNPQRQSWRIGIKHPRQSGVAAILSIENIGAATTGDYQRYFIQDGIRYHHVFDPKSGYPSQGKQSVTVVGPETLVCDALSTALFVSEKPEKTLKKYPQYGAVVIDSEGKVSLIGKEYPIRREK